MKPCDWLCYVQEHYLRRIMPMREMVAGEAQLRSWVSNRKLTLGPNWILSPLGIVSKRLSSSTEFNDSIHSGSMSPSHMIHELTSERERMTSGWRKSQLNFLSCVCTVFGCVSVVWVWCLLSVFECALMSIFWAC